MKLDFYQIDAFASRAFEGNQAGVCPLDAWLPDAVMQAIAEENNVAETAFFVAHENGFDIRWFTPAAEVDLCGHATLASAYVLFEKLGYSEERIDFHSKSGLLSVVKQGGTMQLDFPEQYAERCDLPDRLLEALGLDQERVVECGCNEDFVLVVDSEQTVASLSPNFSKLNDIDIRGVIVTAASKKYDFVCRFFGPQVGINEDSVTGSAFTKLAPLWAEKLGKTKLRAKQISARGGEVNCELVGDRVLISGSAVCYLEGEIEI